MFRISEENVQCCLRSTKRYLDYLNINPQSISFGNEGLVKTVVLNNIIYKVTRPKKLRDAVLSFSQRKAKQIQPKKDNIIDLCFVPQGAYGKTLH